MHLLPPQFLFKFFVDNISIERSNIYYYFYIERKPALEIPPHIIYHKWNACRGVCHSGSKVTKKVETDNIFLFFFLTSVKRIETLYWSACFVALQRFESFSEESVKWFSKNLAILRLIVKWKLLVTVREWKFIHFFFVTRKIAKVFFSG